MVTKELLEYIKRESAKGTTTDVIKSSLLQNGWSLEDIADTYKSIGPTNPVSPPAQPTFIPTMPMGQTTATQAVQPTVIQPQPVQQPAQPITQPNFSTVEPIKKSGKRWAVGVVVLLILLIGGGAAYASYAGYFTSLSTVTSKAFESARRATSASFDATLVVDISKASNGAALMRLLPGGAPQKFTVTTKGSYDLTDKETLKSNAVISFILGSISGAVELRVTNGTLYGQLTKSPALSFIPILSQFERKWVSFPYASNTTPTPLPIMQFTGIDPSVIEGLTDEQKNHLLDITSNARFITVLKKLTPEDINGVSSYHFTFDLNRDGITNYLEEVQAYIKSAGKDSSQLSSFDITSSIKMLDGVKNFSGEAWIGKKDHLPYKISTKFDIVEPGQPRNSNDIPSVPGGTTPTIDPPSTPDDVVSVSLITLFSDWNKPVTVEVPSGAMTFEEMVQQVIGGSLDIARTKGKDASAKGSLSSMRAHAEIYYDNHKGTYKGVCASTEMKRLASAVIEQTSAEAFVCKDTATAYAASTMLGDGSYFCVDSMGYAGTAKKQTALKCELSDEPIVPGQ